MENVKAIANYFIERSQKDKVPLDPLKLQKLLYYAYGWYLAFNDKPLFGERIEAWDYGPVVASVYHEFKHLGGSPIKEYVTEVSLPSLTIEVPSIDASDKNLSGFLKRIWDVHKGVSGIQLSNATHEEGSPWSLARKAGNPVLKDEDIKKHFLDLKNAGKA